MFETEQEILSNAYQYYLETGKREMGYDLTDWDTKVRVLPVLDCLADDGYIQYTAQSFGFSQFKITPKGIRFAENGFKESDASPVIQGNNSIYVNGSGNTVTDNYNKISIDIAASDLPDDCKQLIEAFLYEIKNPHLTQEKKSEKIKSFLSDISSGTISGIAATALSTLFMALFKQITF